jgi:hypothetical protein
MQFTTTYSMNMTDGMIAVNDEFIQKKTGQRYVVRTISGSPFEYGVYFVKLDWHQKNGNVIANHQAARFTRWCDNTIAGFIPV